MKKKIISLALLLGFIFQQTGLAQVAGQINISGYLQGLGSGAVLDKFRPLHMRYFSYDTSTDRFSLVLDKGDLQKEPEEALQGASGELLKYFLIGITLPDSAFWVNLRPDSAQRIIDPELSKTDVGKILLEADLQLKKDTARFTSPETPEGKDYWNKLYKKAGELFGTENITIPTLTRPWIVPGEMIIRETEDSAFVYKANLKVMLEQDHLKGSAVYNFKDERMKQLNEYASQVIRETILPKLTKEVNISRKYAPLRQVFYSLILARWFKARFAGKPGVYPESIDRKNLTGLTSQYAWSVGTYFDAYKKSFNGGEYNIKEPVFTPSGQVIRTYFSGGIALGPGNMNLSVSSPLTTGISAFRARDNQPLHPSFLTLTGVGTVPFPKTYLETRAESLRKHPKPDKQGPPYLMPQLQGNIERIVGGPHNIGIFGKKDLQRMAKALKVTDSDLVIVLQEVTNDYHIPILVSVGRGHVEIATGVLHKEENKRDPSLKRKLRQFIGLSASSPTVGLVQYAGKSVKIIDFFQKSGLSIADFANAVASAAYPEEGACYPATLYPVSGEIYVDKKPWEMRSSVMREAARNDLRKGLEDFLGKQGQPVSSAASPVMTKSAEAIQPIILELLAPKEGDGPFPVNLKELAAYLNVGAEQLCFDLANLGCLSPNLFVAAKKNTPDGANDQDVYFSRNLIPRTETMVIALKAGDPAMIEDSFNRLQNTLRAKVGLPIRAVKAPEKNLVPKAAKLSLSDFQANQMYNIFGSEGVLKIKGVTIDELAAWFANIDVTNPDWHITVTGGRFQIIPVSKPTKLLKEMFVGQGEAARKQVHLNTLSGMANLLHKAGVSSPVSDNELGGIDFTVMNTMIQPTGSFSGLNFRLPKLPDLALMDLDKEEADLSNMVKAGIIPSGERLKEYLAACHYRNEISERTQGLLTCLIQVCRLEEEGVTEVSPELKETIVIADSGRFVLD